MTAEDCARAVMQSAGIYDVRIERIRGNLTDHYSPHEKVLRLSDSVYGSTSVAALGVAALFSSILQLLRLVLIVQGSGRRRR